MDTKETVIPFETTRVPNGDKPTGFEEVIQDGVEGKRTVVTIEGQITSDKTVAPRNEVVFFGTKEEESDEQQPSENTQVDEYSTITPIVDVSHQEQGRFEDKQENTTMQSKLLKKALLEAGRLLVFAIPGILITVLTSNPELGGSLGATILLVLKSVDRGIHDDKTNDVKGLLPF